MITISPSIFCRFIGVDYPPTNPSLTNLIESLSKKQLEIAFGRIIFTFGRPQKQESLAKEALLAYVAHIESQLSKIESDVFFLSLHYFGISWSDRSTKDWWWSNKHLKICNKILSDKWQSIETKSKFFMLVADEPTNIYKKNIESLILDHINFFISNNQFDLINDISNFYLNMSPEIGKSEDQFYKKIISTIIFYNSKNKNGPIHANIVLLLNNLVSAIARDDNIAINKSLKELNIACGNSSNVITNEYQYFKPDDYVWEDRFRENNNLDVGWWRERD